MAKKESVAEAKLIEEIKKEVVYERRELLGGILAFWCKKEDRYVGKRYEIQIEGNFDLEVDRLFINGIQIRVGKEI